MEKKEKIKIYNSKLDEEAAIANLFQILNIDFKPQYIFGLVQALDFRIEEDEKHDTYKIIPIKDKYSMLEALIDTNLLEGIEKKEPQTKKHYLYNSLVHELVDNYIITEIKYKNESGSYESHFVLLTELNENNSTITFLKHNIKKPIVMDAEETTAEMFKALKGVPYYLIPKSNSGKKINYKKIVPSIIKKTSDYFFTKSENAGIDGMLNFEKTFIEICDDYHEFKKFAKIHLLYWGIDESAKSGYRDHFFSFLNETIKKADDSIGELKCAHEIYKEVKNRWVIFTELLEKASKSENKLKEHKDELIHRYHFLTDESEQLALHFLKEYNEVDPNFAQDED